MDLLSLLKVIFEQVAAKLLFLGISFGTVNGDENISICPCSVLHASSYFNIIRHFNGKKKVFKIFSNEYFVERKKCAQMSIL